MMYIEATRNNVHFSKWRKNEANLFPKEKSISRKKKEDFFFVISFEPHTGDNTYEVYRNGYTVFLYRTAY